MSADLLTLSLQHQAGAVLLDVSFTLTQPWTVLFGPSGSGKTTLLRAIAGFLPPRSGNIVFAGQTLFSSARGIDLPPHLRPVRTAAQTARLFPHMSLRSNILYGNGWSSKPQEAAEIADQLLTAFRIQHLAERRPHSLSGGERQRASVARALLSAITFNGPQPPVLLLDEPFAGLDDAIRDATLAELQSAVSRWHIPVLAVTHDIGEAFQLAAEVIRLSEGRILQQGPAADVLAEERSRLFARLSSPDRAPDRTPA